MQETHGASSFFLPALFRRLNGLKPGYRKFSFRSSIPFHFLTTAYQCIAGIGKDCEAIVANVKFP